MSQTADRANADLVRRADAARYAATMLAPAAVRPALLALYAFHIEVARAPWAAREPMLGEIRLQYWLDQIEAAANGAPVDRHPVLRALAPLVAAGRLDAGALAAMVTARRRDLQARPFADRAALMAYLEATAGGLMQQAAGLLAPAPPDMTPIGTAAGLAAYLGAYRALRAHGRSPLPRDRPEFIADLAREGLERLGRAPAMPRVLLPALLTASEARPLLRLARRAPEKVLQAGLARSDLRQRARRLACAVTGRV